MQEHGPKELSDSVPEIGLAAVNAWSITAFANLLDACSIWLTDGEAVLAQQNPCCIALTPACCFSCVVQFPNFDGVR